MLFDSPRCRILIVDSSIEMLALMANLLRPYGFDLIATSTPDDAVRQAATFLPEAVYMGLEYDQCNGWELADRLRKVEGMKEAMLVGLCDRQRGWQSLDGKGSNGFGHYLPKPPCMADIVTALTRELPNPYLPLRPDVPEFRQHYLRHWCRV
jgi:CheY-like chemotaxis protein